ncbi:MAG TPA: argininosuccinate synthase [Phycisphaerae bacterium]|jgi:argininosuccinate synthase|nr:argininosuccinate synthase [Phycisphaerae bacterium]HOB75198.1 argininosuccinate synthase [Phycisphaerae bacterium]HOJ54679.1 argininosuccinate synthase [Phycisphaerae bacterium]HOL25971.1 argininosuccinate synthase [Phycisphaerae bacterium]HPP19457.1 argininosuccinate synthase [Phycisphaerae bacterium]
MADNAPKKVVLAYSGGLDTSVILPWIRETYGCEVVAYAAELGQGDELKAIQKKALKSGASECIVRDLRSEFVNDFVWPMLKSGAIYEGKYLLGTSIARPLIAKEQVRVAHEVGADAVAHGATGKGNDQIRFEVTYMALDPSLKIIAPWKDPRFELRSREAAIEYAKARNIPVEASKKKIYSRDRNLWHISHEGAELEGTWAEPRDEMLVLSVPIEKAPNKAAYVEVDFEAGVPVGLNGKKMDGVEIIQTLNKLGGKHGVGQVDLVENRLVGMKSRGVYETPGGTILYTAHAALESICLDRDTLHYKQQVALRYAELVYYGQWYTPLREALDAFFDRTQKNVTGTARIKLYKGNCRAVGVKSPYSLFMANLASFTMGEEYDQTDAKGFVKLFGLPAKVSGIVARQTARKRGKSRRARK